MCGRSTGIHDPDAAFRVGVRETDRLRGRAWHGYRHVHPRLRLGWTAHMDPERSKLRFRPLSGFLRGFERSPALFCIRNRFHLQALSDAFEVRNACALRGEWLLAGLSRTVVADEPIR